MIATKDSTVQFNWYVETMITWCPADLQTMPPVTHAIHLHRISLAVGASLWRMDRYFDYLISLGPIVIPCLLVRPQELTGLPAWCQEHLENSPVRRCNSTRISFSITCSCALQLSLLAIYGFVLSAGPPSWPYIPWRALPLQSTKMGKGKILDSVSWLPLPSNHALEMYSL